jgi:hypothetical protein
MESGLNVIIAGKKSTEHQKTLKDQRAKNFFALLIAIVHGKIKTGDAGKTPLIG